MIYVTKKENYEIKSQTIKHSRKSLLVQLVSFKQNYFKILFGTFLIKRSTPL